MLRIGLLLITLLFGEVVFAQQMAEVTASSLQVRSSPAGAVSDGLQQGTIVELVEVQGDWAYIRYSNSIAGLSAGDGWVAAQYLVRLDPPRSPQHQADSSVAITLLIGVLLIVVLIASCLRWQRRSTTTPQTPSLPPEQPQTDTAPLEKPPQSLNIESLKSYRVRYVIDGDTVVIGNWFDTDRIRLYAIDCPEDGQPWGDMATAGLIKLIGGKTIKLEPFGTDKYNRTLGMLYVWSRADGNWINVNEKMVVKGHAWVMRRFYGDLTDDRKKTLNDLERWAKRKRVGLWRTENPIAPWEWRKEKPIK